MVRTTAFAILIVAVFAGAAQTTGRVVRLSFVDPLRWGTIGAGDAFWGRLHDLGWVKGENLVVIYRSAEGRSNEESSPLDGG